MTVLFGAKDINELESVVDGATVEVCVEEENKVETVEKKVKVVSVGFETREDTDEVSVSVVEEERCEVESASVEVTIEVENATVSVNVTVDVVSEGLIGVIVNIVVGTSKNKLINKCIKIR